MSTLIGNVVSLLGGFAGYFLQLFTAKNTAAEIANKESQNQEQISTKVNADIANKDVNETRKDLSD